MTTPSTSQKINGRPRRLPSWVEWSNKHILRRENVSAHNALVDAWEALTEIKEGLEGETPKKEELRSSLKRARTALSVAGICLLRECEGEIRIRCPETTPTVQRHPGKGGEPRDGEEDYEGPTAGLPSPEEFRNAVRDFFSRVAEGPSHEEKNFLEQRVVEMVKLFSKGWLASISLLSPKNLVERNVSLLGDYKPSKALYALVREIIGGGAPNRIDTLENLIFSGELTPKDISKARKTAEVLRDEIIKIAI